MNERLKTHVDSLFAGAPQTQKVLELKEELLANLNSKYDDLLAKGLAPDDAYRAVIAGIGDTSELVGQIQNESAFNNNFPANAKKKSALLVSIAVGLYIFSPFSVMLLSGTPDGMRYGPIIMFFLIAVATSLLIFNSMTTPRYIKKDETIVEEFKLWKSDTSKRRHLRRSVSAVLWPLIIVIYFLISIFFHAWAFSWIIFIIGFVCEGVVSLFFDLKG